MLGIYQIYRTYGVDSLICFAVLSASLFLMLHPKPRFSRIPVLLYVLMCVVSFGLLFQGGFFLFTGGDRLIYTKALDFLYFFVCSLGVSLLFSSLFLQGGIFSQLLHILFFITAMQMYRGVCMPLYEQESIMDPETYVLFDWLTAAGLYGLLCGLAALFLRFGNRGKIPPDRKLQVAILFLLCSLLLYTMLPVYLTGQLDTRILSILLLLDLPAVYYVYARFLSKYEEQRHLDAALARMLAEKEAYTHAEELRKKLREERHELKNRYFHLQVLLQEKKYQELVLELENVTGRLSESLPSIETGSTYLNYLLTRKEEQAKSWHIPFRVEAMLPEILPIEESAAGTALVNLLDNALEASHQEQNPDILVTMRCVNGYFHCRISNRISRNVLASNPDLKTTKPDRLEHGYGLSIVRKVLEQADGMLSLSVEQERFTAGFALPLLEAENEPG